MSAADVAAAWALSWIRQPPAFVSTRHFASRRGRIAGVPIDAVVGRRIRAEISISHAVARAVDRPSTVVHSGVPNAPAGTVRRASVLIAQRLEAEKRTEDGIRVFAAARLAELGWVLDIAGDGAERPGLEDLARDLGVPVSFLGFRADLAERFASAGILLAPCPIEGLGLTVLEAMASGLPVIAANGGGHTEILEGLDARALYAPEDVDAAAAGLRSLADDNTGRAALGAAARDRQRTAFSLTAQVAGTDSVYRAALAAEQ
jgi:glycosyltransferase involved in cell wall biosynthesis